MASSSSQPLSAQSLIHYIASSLSANASPQLNSPSDSIAIACHAGMLAVGFRLIGLGEDHRIEAHSSPTDTQPLPQEWNTSTSYAFRYKHSQSSMEYLLKVQRMGNKIQISGIGLGDDKIATFDITTKDYISDSALPATPVTTTTNTDDTAHAIQTIFISPSRLTDLGSMLRVNVIQRLMPGLQKEGYEESTTQASTRQEERQRQEDDRQSRAPVYDPLREPYMPEPARPRPLVGPDVPRPTPDFAPPGFEDEHEILRPRGGRPAGAFPDYGYDDLYPQGLGPRDPLGGPVGPGYGGRRPLGGMHPPGHPFGGGQGGGYDPQAPPGARYDPVGPDLGGPPQGGMGGGPRRFGPGAPPNPFGGFGSGDFI